MDYYEHNAADYFQASCDVDMSPLYEKFLELIPPASTILDAGCGSGRDSKAFMDLGYRVTAIDSSPSLAKLAENHIQHSVEVCHFQEISYEKKFDGIWACASLLHVPRVELPGVFLRLLQALKPGGVLYVSFKYGSGEHQRNGRWFTDMDETKLPYLLEQVEGVTEVESWVSEDRRPDRDSEYWFNVLLQIGGGVWLRV